MAAAGEAQTFSLRVEIPNHVHIKMPWYYVLTVTGNDKETNDASQNISHFIPVAPQARASSLRYICAFRRCLSELPSFTNHTSHLRARHDPASPSSSDMLY